MPPVKTQNNGRSQLVGEKAEEVYLVYLINSLANKLAPWIAVPLTDHAACSSQASQLTGERVTCEGLRQITTFCQTKR